MGTKGQQKQSVISILEFEFRVGEPFSEFMSGDKHWIAHIY